MATLDIVIAGVSLWIDCDSYWNVLFPRKSGSNKQHFPKVSMHVDTHVVIPPFALGSGTLDLRHLLPTDEWTDTPDWMLPMHAAAASDVRGKRPEALRNVVANVWLSKSVLSPEDPALLGPVDFDGEDYSLGWATHWTCETAATNVTLRVRDRVTAKQKKDHNWSLGRKNLILIANLTQEEHNGTFGKTKKGDALDEVSDVLQLCEMHRDPPIYNGDDLGVAAVSGARAATIASPEKLCPQTLLI